MTQVTRTDAHPVLRRRWVILSPLAVILLGHVVARLWSELFPGTAWIALSVIYWAAIGAVTVLGTTRQQRRSWWAPSARLPWWVVPVALLLGIGPIAGILLPNLHLLAEHAVLIAPWLLFALVNPVMEERYWRGALADAVRPWPVWAAALFTTSLFVISHPLMWGVFSEGNRSPMLYGALVLMGLAWFAIRRATGSLRWAWASHLLVNVGNLSVLVFVNAYVPPALH